MPWPFDGLLGSPARGLFSLSDLGQGYGSTPDPVALDEAKRGLLANALNTPQRALINPNLAAQGDKMRAAAATRNENLFQDPENSLRALGMLPVPVVSDAAGLLADLLMYKDKPEERTMLNFGLTGLGALPFVPALGGMIKRKDLPLDKSAYEAVSRGSAGQEIFHNGQSVGMVGGKLSNAVDTFLNELADLKGIYESRSNAAKSAYQTRLQNAKSAELTKQAMTDYKDVIANAHKNADLTFTPIDNAAFNSPSAAFVYQSPAYGKKPGSAYKVIDVGGRPAYARQSDHWGEFSTNRYDEYGNPVSDSFNWQLPGVETRPFGKDRYTGYIFLDDLMKKPPK